MLLAASSSNAGATVGAVFLLIIGVVLYFIPTIIALARRREANIGGVIALNIFLGWTLVGWVIALVMACGLSCRPPRE